MYLIIAGNRVRAVFYDTALASALPEANEAARFWSLGRYHECRVWDFNAQKTVGLWYAGQQIKIEEL